MTTSGTAGDRPSASTGRTSTRLGLCVSLCVGGGFSEGMKIAFLYNKREQGFYSVRCDYSSANVCF